MKMSAGQLPQYRRLICSVSSWAYPVPNTGRIRIFKGMLTQVTSIYDLETETPMARGGRHRGVGRSVQRGAGPR
jgi:hypothetical protein